MITYVYFKEEIWNDFGLNNRFNLYKSNVHFAIKIDSVLYSSIGQLYPFDKRGGGMLS